MGINTHYYTFWGVVLDYNLFGKNTEENIIKNEQFHEELYTAGSSSKWSYIGDGMNGEYLLLGKILFDSGDLRWSDFEDTWQEIPLDKLPELDVEWRKAFQEDVPDYAYLIDNVPSKLITLAHYS